MKLRVIIDASVLLKCWFYKQAPQKVLIELSPGVVKVPRIEEAFNSRNILMLTALGPKYCSILSFAEIRLYKFEISL
jgi:hypothetical protein